MEEFRSGNGTAWLDFLATHLGRYRETQVDQLSDPRALKEWLRLHDLDAPGPTERDLAAARDLREALHAVTVAALKKTAAAPADLRVIESILRNDRPLKLRKAAGGFKALGPASVSEALARLARQAIVDLTGANRELLHACGDEACSGIFLDQVGRRRWCSDERCGNRARVRAHRARAKEAEEE
jgi:predicted RNA-binding Zn ribbon-like protein